MEPSSSRRERLRLPNRTSSDRVLNGAGPRRSKSLAGTVRLPKLMGINELADHLGVGVRHVRQLVAERRIPYKKCGNLLRFDPDEVAG